MFLQRCLLLVGILGGVEPGGPLLELGTASLLFVIRREVDASN